LDAVQYQNFLRAVETGKWPDGKPVQDKQKALMLQAIIIFENQHLPPEQRSGFMPDACASNSQREAAVKDKTDNSNVIISSGKAGN
ncbi:MAG: DUF1315 family protein, partial [Pseudomonadales bacterium]